MPVCADGLTDMFEKRDFDLRSISRECMREYGVAPDASTAVREWGGREMHGTSNIIFSNGDRDPWSAGGVLEPIAPSITVIRIPHACHHEDLRSPGPNDPPALLAARRQEVRILRKWIKEFRERQTAMNAV